MKKLMIAAAVAAMTAGAFAALCDIDKGGDECQAYEISVKLKTLAPKTIKCSGGKCGVAGCVSYYKNGNRNLKGILWNCVSQCDLADANLVLWRTDKGYKNAIAMNGDYFSIDGNKYKAMSFQDLDAEAWRYEKKGDKVSMVWTLADAEEAYYKDGAWEHSVENKNGDTADLSTYSLMFAGLGSFDKKKEQIKNVSGNVAGYVTGDPTIKFCDFEYACLVDLCEDFEAVCDDAVPSTGDEHLAAYGTWKMKFSKQIAGGNKSIAGYLPSFAK